MDNMRRINQAIAILMTLIIFSSSLLAQESNITTVLRQSVKEVVSNSVSAITLFTSQNEISGGSYELLNGNLPSINIDVYKLPLSYKFGEPDDELRFFVSGDIAALFIEEEIDAAGFGKPYDKSEFNTYSITIGGGLDYRFADKFYLRPFMGFSYSHIENEYSFRNPYTSSPPLRGTLDQITNWDVDVGTLSPGLKASYLNDFKSVNIELTSAYVYLYSFDFSSSVDIGSISANSSVWHNSLLLDIPGGFSVRNWPFHIKPLLGRADIYGDSRNELPFNSFYEIGITLTFVNPDSESWLSQIGFGVTYVYDSEVEGCRFGVVF